MCVLIANNGSTGDALVLGARDSLVDGLDFGLGLDQLRGKNRALPSLARSRAASTTFVDLPVYGCAPFGVCGFPRLC